MIRIILGIGVILLAGATLTTGSRIGASPDDVLWAATVIICVGFMAVALVRDD